MSRSSFDGLDHSRDGKLVFAVVGTVGLVLSIWYVELGLGLLAGAFMGWWLTPDIDHQGMTHEEYRAIKRLKLLGVLWVAYWGPYSYFVPHRSKISHGPLGTLSRYLYLMVPFWAVFYACVYLLDTSGSLPWQTVPPPWQFNAAMLGAWWIQDLVHLVRDGCL